jgi:hypothetical protein
MIIKILELSGKMTDEEEIQNWLDDHSGVTINEIRINNNFVYIFYTAA